MKALQAHERGGPEVLRLEDVPDPVPAPDEVLVAVHAAAITFDELVWDETWSRLPATPSHEVSGVVAAVGADVRRFGPGDEVYTLIPFDRVGGAAEYVAVPESAVARRPRAVTHVEAAALPLAGLTAWQALVDHAHLRRGERLLVLGGAGGVGVFTTQLGCELDAVVTATVRGSDAVKAVLELGAAHVVDVATDSASDLGEYDVIVDTVGGAALASAYSLAAPGGRLVTLQAPPDEAEASRHEVDAMFFIVRSDQQELEMLADMVERGQLSIPVRATFPLADGRRAFESRGLPGLPVGKTVLVVSG